MRPFPCTHAPMSVRIIVEIEQEEVVSKRLPGFQKPGIVGKAVDSRKILVRVLPPLHRLVSSCVLYFVGHCGKPYMLVLAIAVIDGDSECS